MPPDFALPARLREVPWAAADGLSALLGPALAQVLAGTAAEHVLDRALRAHRDLTADQRRVTAEALFGVGLWRRRLAAQCPLTTPGPLDLLETLQALSGHPGPLQPRPAPEDWPTLHSVPDWLAAELTRAVGAEAPALAAALNVPGPIALRTNLLRTTPTDLAAVLLAEGLPTHPGRWAASCLIADVPRPNLTGLDARRRALFEVQDEGSQVLGLALGVAPGATVLDLCAGAGGKTLQLASLLGGQGALHAADVDLGRLERLRQRAFRAGATVHVHGRAPAATLRVSHVLVDAPCSELGALRRGPDLRWRLDPATFAAWPPLQRELLERGATHLLPGGRLLYATCTLRPEENEAVVDAFLATHPDFTLVPPAVPPALLDARGFLRTFPHRHGTDGFFAALLARR